MTEEEPDEFQSLMPDEIMAACHQMKTRIQEQKRELAVLRQTLDEKTKLASEFIRRWGNRFMAFEHMAECYDSEDGLGWEAAVQEVRDKCSDYELLVIPHEEAVAVQERGRRKGLKEAEGIARRIYRASGCSNHNFSIEPLRLGCVSCAIADKIEAAGERPKEEEMTEVEKGKAKRLVSLRTSYDHHPPECECPLCILFPEIERVEKERDRVAGELRSLRLSVGLGEVGEG